MNDYEEEDEEPTEIECHVCAGYGEFANNSYSTYWVTCSACNGTGIELDN
jgi:DnaJ-class molecular chaperone